LRFEKGFALGSFLVFLLMMFFGIMGMIAYANDPEAYDNFEKFSYLAFFDLLLPLGNGWHIVVLIFVTALAASSIDSLQNGLTSVFYHDLVRVGWNPKLLTRVLVVLVNIPAIWLASKKFYVLELFLVADLVCATAVFPTFLGLQETDKMGGLLPAPTELGAFMGIMAGFATVLVNGAVNDAEGGLFQYFWLRNDAICALCGSKTMTSFILTPTISCIMTYVFTHIDIAVRGERARSPIFEFAFDKEDDETDDAPKKLEDGEAQSAEKSEEEAENADKSEEEAENADLQAVPEDVASHSEEEAA
jgi:SSS family solute:Na+ symporter